MIYLSSVQFDVFSFTFTFRVQKKIVWSIIISSTLKPLVKIRRLMLTRWNKFRSSTENNNYSIILHHATLTCLCFILQLQIHHSCVCVGADICNSVCFAIYTASGVCVDILQRELTFGDCKFTFIGVIYLRFCGIFYLVSEILYRTSNRWKYTLMHDLLSASPLETSFDENLNLV